ncbi:MAG: aldehyde dehydrogenase family protein, partial [Candidatus Nanopelagicales bacterium]
MPVSEAMVAGGRSLPGSSGEHLDVVNPATGAVLDTIELASRADVGACVAAAAAAGPDWATATPADRAAAPTRHAAPSQARAAEYALV